MAQPGMEKSKSTNKLTALFGREPTTVKEAAAQAAAQSRATGITSRAKEPIKGWVRKLPGDGHLPVVSSLAQKVYLKMQASWEGEGSIVKYYSEQSCTATSYKGTIRLKTVTSIVVDKENGNRFHIETPKKVYHFEAVPSTTNPQHCPTRAAWIQMWADNTNFEEARRNIAALKSIAEGNHENSAGITRPTAEQLAMPRLKHTKKNPALETGTGTQPSAGASSGQPLLTRDMEEKMSNYEKQIADLQRQLKAALSGANGPASPRKNTVNVMSEEDRVKSERLAVLLEMGVVSKAEYEEKMNALSPRGGSPVGSGAASPRNGPPKRGRSAKNKNDTKIAKLNELLSMEVITQEEYDDRLAKIQSQG